MLTSPLIDMCTLLVIPCRTLSYLVIYMYLVTLFSGPSDPTTGVQGTYPYVVWNPPQQPNGIITGYRLTFTRSGKSIRPTVTTSNDQTFYVIQSGNIPWTSGSFSVTVGSYTVKVQYISF